MDPLARDRLVPIRGAEDIPPALRGTPIGRLLEYHDLGRPFDTHVQAQLLVGMCMDSRKHLRIPDNFAFILRAGGANLGYSEFKVSYAVAVGGVRHLALIGHTECGMVDLAARRQNLVDGLVSVGWERRDAEDHFSMFAPMFEIGDAEGFIASEAKRLRLRYPRVTVAPFIYKVADNRLYCVAE